MKLTLHSDYSLRVLLYLAYAEDKWVGTEEISDSYGISKHHLVRVMQTLSEYEFITIKTGRSGGAKLAKAPKDIVIGEVVRKTEQSFRIVECFDEDTNTCPILPMCGLRKVLADAMDAFLKELDKYTLGDLCTPKRRIQFFQIMNAQLELTNSGPAAKT
jgi:Rrf2 family nitric oxide-sensitive transcriptional repressor